MGESAQSYVESTILLSDNILTHQEMLLDLLVHPEGLRLRDSISHGEVCPPPPPPPPNYTSILTESHCISHAGRVLQDWQGPGQSCALSRGGILCPVPADDATANGNLVVTLCGARGYIACYKKKSNEKGVQCYEKGVQWTLGYPALDYPAWEINDIHYILGVR